MVKGLGISEVGFGRCGPGVFLPLRSTCEHPSNGGSRNKILKELFRYLPMT